MNTHFTKTCMIGLKTFLVTICTTTCLVSSPDSTNAQTNYLYHYNDVENHSIDYTANNEYVILGEARPATINGWSNVSTSLGFNLNRIQLQIVDQNLGTTMLKTYCTQAEVAAIEGCNALSVMFSPREAKYTSDNGYIICGHVRSDMETSNCAAAGNYSNPFLLKVDATGAVQWYMRYDADLTFWSVIEDPATGNILVSGWTGDKAFIMGVDNSGAFLWAYEVTSTIPQLPALGTYNQYLRLARYQNSGNTYYAAIGSSGVTGPSNFLLMVVDANGTIAYNQAISTWASGQRLIMGQDVCDGLDNDLVITGHGYAWGVVVLKMDPIGGTTTYMNQYDRTSGDFTFAYGITRGTASGDIFITGEEYNNGAFLFKVDGAGAVVDYETFASSDARRGLDITYNGVLGYPVATGNSDPNYTTFATIDKYANYCATSNGMSAANLSPVAVSCTTVMRNVTPITDAAAEYDLTPNETYVCGMLKKGTTGISKLSANGKLIISPNPANDMLNIQLPAADYNGNLKVVDMMGKVLLSKKLERVSDSQVDISALPAGLYTLVIDNGIATQQSRFVKQ